MATTLLDAKKLIASVADVGLCDDDPRLLNRINEAQRRLVQQYNSLVRSEGYDQPSIEWSPLANDGDELLIDELDATKLVCLALWREENNRMDIAEPLEQKAFAMVQRNLVTAVETASKVAWKALLITTTRGTFGWVKARLGLDCADINLRFTDDRIGRLLNDAEERILMKGKPVGSVQELPFQMDGDGEFYLPENVLSVLYATVSNVPAPVYSQVYDYLDSGPGYQLPDTFGLGDILIDRGEIDGKRRYFVRQKAPNGAVRLLCKMRFVPHTVNTSALLVGNYPALKEMALSVLFEHTDPQRGATHEALSLKLIDDELAERRGGNRETLNISIRGTMKPLRRLR